MADSEITITVSVRNKTDISSGKSIAEHTQYTFTDVVNDVRLLEILESVTPRPESEPISAA